HRGRTPGSEDGGPRGDPRPPDEGRPGEVDVIRVGDRAERSVVEVTTQWAPGMTEQQYFNANLSCGQFPLLAKELKYGVPPYRIDGCGAKSCRVFRERWMENSVERRERDLVCQECGGHTHVVVLP